MFESLCIMYKIIYIIFSTLPSVKETSLVASTLGAPTLTPRPKLSGIFEVFPSRALSTRRELSCRIPKATFLHAKAPDGTWVMTSVNPRTARTPFVDVIGDTAKSVGVIFAEPDKYQGETFCAATAPYSWEEIIATMSKVTGKPVVYRQMTVEEFKKSFLFDAVVDGISYAEGFGKDYLEAYPPQLA